MPSEPQVPIELKAATSMRGAKLGVSRNGRYLVRDNGVPFFYLADTAWTLFKRLDHDEADRYFTNRVAKGFTVIHAYVLRGLEVTNLEGHFPLIDRDPTKLDEGFFRNVDYLVDRANELGLVMGLVATMGEHVTKEVKSERFKTPEQIFNEENAFGYGELLGARYEEHCVIWFLGGDRNPTEANLGIWDAMGRGFKAGSKGQHLVSYHGARKSSSSPLLHQREWLDFNTVQSDHASAEPNYLYIEGDYHLTPPKPTLDMEARYESHPDMNDPAGFAGTRRNSAHTVREAGYWALLAGAAGHGYGHNSVWQMHDELKTDSRNDYTFPLIPPTVTWTVAMDSAGAFGMSYLCKLMELLPWYEIVPDQSLIASEQGEGEDHVQAARGQNGGFIVAYLPFGNPVSIHVDKIASDRVLARWYNPRNGKFSPIGIYANGGSQRFVAPTTGRENDWALVLTPAT